MSEGAGYFDNRDYGDPRVLANAESVDDLKNMLSAFNTLDGRKFSCSRDNLIKIDDEEFDPNDDWTASEVSDYWYRKEETEFEKLIQAVDFCIKTPDDIKSVSVAFTDNAPYVEAEVVEQYVYDKTRESFETTQRATDEGKDVTESMINEAYIIDCGDDSLYFRFNYR